MGTIGGNGTTLNTGSTTLNVGTYQTPNFNPNLAAQSASGFNLNTQSAGNLLSLGRNFFTNPVSTLSSLGMGIGTTFATGAISGLLGGTGLMAGGTAALSSLAATFGLGGLFGSGAAAAGGMAAVGTGVTGAAGAAGGAGLLGTATAVLAAIPVAGWIAIGVGVALFCIFGSPKRKAKKKAKKFNQEVDQLKAQAEQQKAAIDQQVQNGTLTAAEGAAKKAAIDKSTDQQIVAKWNALSPKDQQRIQKYANSVPECAKTLQTVNQSATNMQQADLMSRFPSLNFSTAFGTQNNYQNGQFLTNMLIRDENGNVIPGQSPTNPQISKDMLKNWSSLVFENATSSLDAESYNHATENGKLLKLAGALKNDTNFASFPEEIKTALAKDLTVEANAKDLLTKLDAIDNKIAAHNEDASKPAPTEAELALQKGFNEAEKLIKPTDDEALKMVVDAYKLPIDLNTEKALYNRAEGSTPAEKLANAIFAKLNTNGDGVLDRNEIMKNGYNVDSVVATMFDLVGKSQATYEQSMLSIQKYLAGSK